MTPETKSVLKHWRENWEKAVMGELTPYDIRGDTCAYCKKYKGCIGCPIMIKTGSDNRECGCMGSPWETVNNSTFTVDPVVNKNLTNALKIAVWAELQFLLQIAWEELL